MGLQKDFLCDENGNLLVDFIGHFESLQDDFNIACSKIPIKQVQLPYANKSNHKFYKEYYNNHTRDLIYKAFKEDIELFKYDF